MLTNLYLCLLLVVGVYLTTTTCHAFTLRTTHDEVDPFVTENVSLACISNNKTLASGLYTISRLRILKSLSDDGTWKTLAEIRDNEDSVEILQDYKDEVLGSAHIGRRDQNRKMARGDNIGSGNLLPFSDTHLEMMWPKASNLTIGLYRCDVIGFSENNDVIWEKSSVLDIRKTLGLSLHDVHDLVVRQKSELEEIIKHERNETESLLTEMIRELVNKNVNKEIAEIRETQIFLFKQFIEIWPEGVYGLPEPGTGCPANIGVSWKKGYRKHQTESTDKNHGKVSDPNHLMKPHLYRSGTDNFIFQHFCMVTTNSIGPLWPKGSYCILKYGYGCPEGFEAGAIIWDDENSESAKGGFMPAGDYTIDGTKIYYCCRSDSPASIPIHLPTTRPFYLYRYKGICQSVVNMKVNNEFILFDTDNKDNRDGYPNTVHPDGQAKNDVRLEFCYYQKL